MSSGLRRAAPAQLHVEYEQRRCRRRAQPSRAVVQLRLGERDALADRDDAAGRAHRAALLAQAPQVGDLQLQRRVAAARTERGMRGDPAGAVEQRRGIAAMDGAKRW